MKAHLTALTNTGYPYPDANRPIEIGADDIAALGKLTCWGDARTIFILRLRDGREAIINASQQEKDAERFLRKLAKPVYGHGAPRGGWTITWGADR
jgi:hypothetical protein